MKKPVKKKPEARSQEPVEKARKAHLGVFLLASSFWLLAPLSGCTYNQGGDEPATFRQKQEDVLRDPINYKPDNENTQPYDISGGGINNYDSKAMKRDLDHVLDP